MSKLHLSLLTVTVMLQSVSSLKFISLVKPYLAQSPSTTKSGSEENDESLPLYRDLPPFMKATRDLTEALEATRKLMIVHAPFDDGDFLARLKKAGAEYRAAVIGEPPHLFKHKSGIPGTRGKDQVQRVNEEPQIDSKAMSNTTQITSKVESTNVDHAVMENETLTTTDNTLNVSEEDDPFEEVKVEKLAVEESETTALPIPETDSPLLPPVPPESGIKVGVKVEAPYTHVQVVKRGSSNGYSNHGAEVGVRVEAPFTNVKVKKLAADIPADAIPDIAGVVGGSFPEIGVRVEAPFVKVKVDGPAIHHGSGVGDGAMVPVRKHRDDHPRRNGRPLNLDINIPGIFNLKLLRDETGRGRLGIGVLPVFTSLVNPQKSSDHYPGPPPSY